MLLTTSIKLVANQDQKRQLLKTMYKFNSACDWVSQYAFANNGTSISGNYGTLIITWHDGSRYRTVVGYVGETLDASGSKA